MLSFAARRHNMKSQDATQINTTISIAPQPHGSRSRGNARADAPGPAFFVLGSRPPRSAGSRAIEPAPPLSLRASVWCASAHGTRPRSPMPRVRRGQLLPWITPWAALARAAPPRDHPLGSTCKGCASVLRTCVPRSRAESGEKRSRKYLSVSASQNVSILSSLGDRSESTFLRPT